MHVAFMHVAKFFIKLGKFRHATLKILTKSCENLYAPSIILEKFESNMDNSVRSVSSRTKLDTSCNWEAR